MSNKIVKYLRLVTNFLKIEATGIKRSLNEVTVAEKKPRIESADASTSAEQKRRLPKKKKFALLLSYSGAKYFGMQIQSSSKVVQFNTVENELFNALEKSALLTEIQRLSPREFSFQRAARTDRGVSAVRQICSILLSIAENEITKLPVLINSYLPDDIRVQGIKRATRTFDSKHCASARTYSYTMPTFAFTHIDEKCDESFRISAERIQEVNEILSEYVGTHNFYNFTSKREPTDPSCKRYIINCKCGEPFEKNGLEFVTIELKGQSFLLHQIRKMVGLCITIVRGFQDKSIFTEKVWVAPRVDIPRAPGLGLVLETVHFEWYDGKFSKTHPSISNWPECETKVESFKEEKIMPIIYERELKEKSMIEWLSTLALHDWDNTVSEGTLPLRDARTFVTQKLSDKADSHVIETKETDFKTETDEAQNLHTTTIDKSNEKQKLHTA